MQKELLNFTFAILTVLITSGCFGYVNYIILEKLNTITDRNKSESDKKLKIMFFTGLNFALYWILTNTLKVSISFGIISILAFDIFGTIFLIAPSIWLLKKSLNKIRTTTGQAMTEATATRDYLFNTDKYQELYIFDFDNKLITSGFLDYHQAADNNYFDLSLMPLDIPDIKYDYDSISKIASKHDDSRMLVDFEKRIKIFVFRS